MRRRHCCGVDRNAKNSKNQLQGTVVCCTVGCESVEICNS
jgi:hypothetical protein